MSKQRVIEVVADWVDLGGPTLMGHLTATPARGKEVFAFEYDKQWLSTASRQQLDPSLALYGGPQYPAKRRESFAVFLDSSPDRWGRVLKLNISETDNDQDLDLALSVTPVFRVKKKRAQDIVAEVTQTVNQWRAVATSHAIPRPAQARLRRAFRVAEASAAR